MESSSSSNFYRFLSLAVSFCCLYAIFVLYGDFGREKATSIATRFYTVREVDQILQEKIEEELENLKERIDKIKKENSNFTENNTDEATLKERRKVVLIVTFMRSGSTFLGEMFNNHDDAFYIFEPVHPLARFGLSKSTTNERLEIISNNLNCQFEDKYDITIPWRSFKGDEMELEETLDKRGDFVFRSKHRRLCAPPFCAHDFSNKLHGCNDECGLVDLSLASRVCKPLVSAVKTIRFVEIELLQKMTEESNMDLKLIFLARDPRGILESRVKIYQKNEQSPFVANEKNLKAVDGVCSSTLGILDKIKNSEWLQKRTMIVRYEDLAMEPQLKGAEILQFSGLEINSKIMKWIEENTSQKSSDSGTYDTSRDSKKTALAWRSILDYSSISEIQEKCAKNMDLLGYKQMSTSDPESDVLGKIDLSFGQ